MALPSLADRYVWSESPSEAWPYDTWDRASHTLQSAIDAASGGETVWVTNGTYYVATQVVVTAAVTVASVQGYAFTTVQKTGAMDRVFFVSNANALVTGLRITGGYLNNNNAQGGGGVYLAAGTVSNCWITGNYVGGWSGGGAGVRMFTGTVLTHCRVSDNTLGKDAYGVGVNGPGTIRFCCISSNNGVTAMGRSTWGGGVNLPAGGLLEYCVICSNRVTEAGGGVNAAAGALIRNCLIFDNRAHDDGLNVGVGGGVNGGAIVNCTVVSNIARSAGGVYGSAVTNSIVFFNRTWSGEGQNYSGGSFAYSCASPLPAGAGNVADDPGFVDLARRDCHLRGGSPAVDAGTNMSWMAAAKDLDGRDRILPSGGTNDMGAYEHEPGALSVYFTAEPTASVGATSVVLRAVADGTNVSGLVYFWDFNNDGFVDASGPSAVVTNVFDCGLYSVRVTVSNVVAETSSFVRSQYLTISPSVMYVAPGGGHIAPFTNWTTAATNPADALALANDGVSILIGDGTYYLANHLVLDKAVTLQSVNGPSNAILQRVSWTSSRILTLSHSNAMARGLTIRGGNFGPGAGVLISAGLVTNCILQSNSVPGYSHGGGAYMTGGQMARCLIEDNTGGHDSFGLGVYMTGGLLTHSIIRRNCGGTGTAHGAGVYASGGLVRNCLIYGNVSTNAVARGAGIYGGAAESCTVADNAAREEGGGTYGAAVTNSIVFFNALTVGTSSNYSGGSFAYSCAWPLPPGSGNIAADPQFVDRASMNYRLLKTSPCLDAGSNQTWMAEGTDIDGLPRRTRRVDMGAYELPAFGTVVFIR